MMTILGTTFDVRRLKPEEVLLAQNLLYDVYIEEMQGGFKDANPVGAHNIIDAKGRRCLDDHYAKDAVWIGCIEAGRCIACIQCVNAPDQDGLYQVEHYVDNLMAMNQQYAIDFTRAVFLGRFVVAKSKRQTGLGLLIALKSLSFAKETQQSVVALAFSKSIKRFHEHCCLMHEALDANFIYNPEPQNNCKRFSYLSHQDGSLDKAILHLKSLVD
jgi:hypothetical protein